MEEDLTVEIARVRSILRKSAQSGERTHETGWALNRLRELAQRGTDATLLFEHRRWSFHLESLAAQAE
jgi:hypothetical protein